MQGPSQPWAGVRGCYVRSLREPTVQLLVNYQVCINHLSKFCLSGVNGESLILISGVAGALYEPHLRPHKAPVITPHLLCLFSSHREPQLPTNDSQHFQQCTLYWKEPGRVPLQFLSHSYRAQEREVSINLAVWTSQQCLLLVLFRQIMNLNDVKFGTFLVRSFKMPILMSYLA